MYQVGKTFRDHPTYPEMIVVPFGQFKMGSPETEIGRKSHEGPQRQVTIRRLFAVGKYPVTVGQFAEFVRETKHKISNDWRNAHSGQTDSHPVVCVAWHDAKQYVKWLSYETEKNYRLLSEAEWEYVARAGTKTAYHFGNKLLDKRACHLSTGTASVGKYPENKFGLHDVHGNVWEWVEDCWHGDYTNAPSDGSAWLNEPNNLHVLRGGSWNSKPEYLRSAVRNANVATFRGINVGFRVVRMLSS